MSGSPQVSNVASMSISVPSRGRGPAVNVIPNMALAAQRPWLAAQTQDLLRRGDFRVQVIGVTPPECYALLEAFLIARAFVKEGRRPEVNAGF